MGKKRQVQPKQFNAVPAVTVKPKNKRQAQLIKLIRDNDVTFAIGSAGGGKTFIAISLALKMLLEGQVERIILVRPAVEAGEKLGFLPGSAFEKMEPYLQPAFNAIRKHCGPHAVNQMLGEKVLEIIPLAYMRGVTMENAFIVLDEAQNCTDEQMEMFLTRIGEGSKIVVCGDHTQNDLRAGVNVGLLNAAYLMKDTPGVGVCVFEAEDSVRHRLVPLVINKYTEARNASRDRFGLTLKKFSLADLCQTRQRRKAEPETFLGGDPDDCILLEESGS